MIVKALGLLSFIFLVLEGHVPAYRNWLMMEEFSKLILCMVFMAFLVTFTIVGSLWLILF